MNRLLSKTLLLLLSTFCLSHSVMARKVKTVFLDEKTVARLPISVSGTAISFPTKPEKVILGQKGPFGIEYIENDLVISPRRSDSRANLFVYLFGKRYSFELFSKIKNASTIIIIKDKGYSLEKIQ